MGLESLPAGSRGGAPVGIWERSPLEAEAFSLYVNFGLFNIKVDSERERRIQSTVYNS